MAQKNKNKETQEDVLGNGKPNWPVLIPIIVIFVILLAFVFFL